MHYRNGKEAKNGDKLIQLDMNGKVVAFGVLHSATADNDYCNGYVAPIQPNNQGACLIDCLSVEDIEVMIAEKNLDKRPMVK